MIGFPTFKECRATGELGGRSTCMACKQPIDAVAVVGFIEPEPETLYVEGLGMVPKPFGILTRGRSQAFLAVGPCGHTTLDADEDGFVYRWDA